LRISGATYLLIDKEEGGRRRRRRRRRRRKGLGYEWGCRRGTRGEGGEWS